MPQIRINRGLLIALAKRWHNEHNTFHFPTIKITVTPKDVYRILHILVVGELVLYDSQEQGETDALWRIFKDDHICGYEIPWRDMVDVYATLPSVLARFIGGFLCLDLKSKGLLVRWGQILESMIAQGTRYAWG